MNKFTKNEIRNIHRIVDSVSKFKKLRDKPIVSEWDDELTEDIFNKILNSYPEKVKVEWSHDGRWNLSGTQWIKCRNEKDKDKVYNRLKKDLSKYANVKRVWASNNPEYPQIEVVVKPIY